MYKPFTYSKLRVKKPLTLLALCIALPLCSSSCVKESDVKLPVVEDYYTQVPQIERKNLKLGVVTGPYGDMFMETIAPLFAQKGYSVELVLYSNYTEPNIALAGGEIDFNIFQHYKYLNDFKFNNDMNLSSISEIPTISMGIYSYKYDTIYELQDGAVVALPSDNTNLSRAFAVLESSGIITLNPSVDKNKATENDIIENHFNLQFVPAPAALIVEKLHECDLAVVNGNFALSGGLNIEDALFRETLIDDYINVIAVRTEDLGEPFVMDLLTVLFSDEFKNQIMDADGKYSGFQYPRYFMSQVQ